MELAVLANKDNWGVLSLPNCIIAFPNHTANENQGFTVKTLCRDNENRESTVGIPEDPMKIERCSQPLEETKARTKENQDNRSRQGWVIEVDSVTGHTSKTTQKLSTGTSEAIVV